MKKEQTRRKSSQKLLAGACFSKYKNYKKYILA
jgi:hypothetical protein